MKKLLTGAVLSLALLVGVAPLQGCVSTPVEQVEVGSYAVQIGKARDLAAALEELTLVLFQRERISGEAARKIYDKMTDIYSALSILETVPDEGGLVIIEQELLKIEKELKDKEND